jgi:ATP-binding protein involved in chromosome partitioning
MTIPAPETLAAALDRIADPARGGGLVASGRAGRPRLSLDGTASVILEVAGLETSVRTALEAQVKAALLAEDGVREVRVLMTAEKPGRRLIAVGSGKGGVGKSTLSANLAIALHRLGKRVGLVDADIYGPSQPRIMATEGIRPYAESQVMFPIQTKWGVPMLSMGQLIAPDKAIAWRGPMASGALAQLIDANWAETNTLVVDLPPGTGDVQLSMIQKHRPAGAVIVSTPQDLSLIDAARAIDLFRTANIPIWGLVENMAGYACPHCGEVSDPFGCGGAEAEATRLGIPFLGRVPLDPAIRKASDAGEPPAARDDATSAPFFAIAQAVLRAMDPATI